MFWKEEPITQIDIYKLKDRKASWHEDDEKRRVKKNSLKPPPAKKQFLAKPGNWRYGNSTKVIEKPIVYERKREAVMIEVETGQCLFCSSMINHKKSFCDYRCEKLFKE